jgi:autophagy-related protein 13
MSASSSPGKPISPHTPHTPAIPSRLSANSIVEYTEPRQRRQREASDARLEDVTDDDDDDQANELGTNAIDIPTSPRPYHPHNRRSSSVAQQHRALAVDDDLGELPFGVHRSISLGADDREPPSLNALRGIGQIQEVATTASSESPSRLLQPAPHIIESGVSQQPLSSLDAQESETLHPSRRPSAGSSNSPYRPRIGKSGGRGVTPSTGSYTSLADRGSGSITSERGGRYSFTRGPGHYEADDEPLVFDMSEIGRDQSRQSLDEARGSGNAGRGEKTYESTRDAGSGPSSRQGSRRGWQ